VSLERASRRLKLNLAGGPPEDRVRLLHGALTYRDKRWEGVDAAALVEVIEHFDPNRLPALQKIVFGLARPEAVVVSTPNADYNALFANLPAGQLRHPDHRFEWTRGEFAAWAQSVAAAHGYRFEIVGIGAVDAERGAPTQMAVFRREGA
jgi:3' terminal RNA ribose 2'-O-methyltransferase Hen1